MDSHKLRSKFAMWVNCVCFKNIMPYHTIVFFLLFTLFPLSQLLWNIRKLEAKNHFTYNQKANTIQLFVATKRNFSGLFFFWTNHSKGEFLGATCLFAYYYNRHYVAGEENFWVQSHTWWPSDLGSYWNFGSLTRP